MSLQANIELALIKDLCFFLCTRMCAYILPVFILSLVQCLLRNVFSEDVYHTVGWDTLSLKPFLDYFFSFSCVKLN